MTREFSDADADVFNELWAGALFDIILSVFDKCKDWEKDDQSAMIYMIIEQLAERYGIVEDMITEQLAEQHEIIEGNENGEK
jgi:hypothetical protein